LLRLAPDLKHRVTQTRVGRDAELLRLESNAGFLMPVSEVSMLLVMRGLRFSSKRDLRVEMRLASDDLSLVIFEQPTHPPILVTPVSGKPFLLYVRVTDHSLGAY